MFIQIAYLGAKREITLSILFFFRKPSRTVKPGQEETAQLVHRLFSP